MTKWKENAPKGWINDRENASKGWHSLEQRDIKECIKWMNKWKRECI